MNPKLDASFLAAVQVKAAFHPSLLKRAQAAILYCALAGGTFTADEAMASVALDSPDDTTTAGCATGSLASMQLIVAVGRIKSPSPKRNGSRVNLWTLNHEKRSTVLTWLTRQGFPQPVPESYCTQPELALT